ncbi:DUF2589 domain-containing protein [Reichenbachiella versicolor]|uniref:DUF2589 domain-containing protein n=1 Tax=Reichenbachiella versicolor TaxID=1821036 RepID=UPI000D6DFFDC|nr:DUF2589 domain-containing protein [Reichenbachiella versicolor]
MNTSIYDDAATGLEKIFSAPLNAVIDADIRLANSIANFIESYGFENSDEGDVEKGNIETKEEDDAKGGKKLGPLRMISFTYNQDGKKVTIKIPALSLIQLPLLQIKKADFDMEVQLFTMAVDNQSKQNNNTEIDEKVPSLEEIAKSKQRKSKPPKVLLRGVMTASSSAGNEDKLKESMKANMKVKLEMGASDMPGGLINMLAVLNDVTEVQDQVGWKITNSPEQPEVVLSDLTADREKDGNTLYHFSVKITASLKDSSKTEIPNQLIVLVLNNQDIDGITFNYLPDKPYYQQYTNAWGETTFTVSGVISSQQFNTKEVRFKTYLEKNNKVASEGTIKFIGELTKSSKIN